MPNRILVIFAHPAIHRSVVNRQMAALAREVPGVTFHDLYETYPDFLIDVKKEQQLLVDHDVVVFQHPFYWYSAPAMIKEWCDLVLEFGWAYGTDGSALVNKAWIHAITTGGSELAYSPEGVNRFSIRQLLLPYEQTAYLCGMHFLAPMITYATMKLNRQTDVPDAAKRYRYLLESLRDTTMPWSDVSRWKVINDHIHELR